jgi:hypothetical protein
LPPVVQTPPPPVTVTAGQAATYSISVAAGTGDPSQPTTLSCQQSTLPNGVSCAFTPPQVTFASANNTTFQLSMNTTGTSALLSNPPSRKSNLPLYASLFPLAGVVLLGVGGKARRKLFVLGACVLVMCLLLLSACGTNGTFGAPPPSSLSATPPGQYTVVILGQTPTQVPSSFTIITSVSVTVQ